MIRIKTEFNILPAYNGDCILIKTFDKQGNEFVILIDGGTSATFEYSLKKKLKGITKIDLLVLTHIDSDHIGGLIKFFKNSLIDKIEIDQIWINQPDFGVTSKSDQKALISVPQAEDWKALIKSKKPQSKLREITTDDKTIIIGGLIFTILSPTPEIKDKLYEIWKKEKDKFLLKQANLEVKICINEIDYTKSLIELNKESFKPDSSISTDIYNSSSIAFILQCPDISLLLLGDSRPEIIAKSIRKLGNSEDSPLEVDYVKISHHGSLNNTSQELLSLIRSNKYILSTNGGTGDHKHPSRETIARIVYKVNRNENRLNIYTNYSIKDMKTKIGEFISDDDLKEGNWNIEHENNFIS
jgi:beta-lactamase superfamily II metal-dependent hydrolase